MQSWHENLLKHLGFNYGGFISSKKVIMYVLANSKNGVECYLILRDW